MKPSPAPTSPDFDAIAEALAQEDSGDSGPASSTPHSSTLVGLKAELETLAERLRESPPTDEFAAESYCDRAIAAVEQIGRDPSFSTRDDIATQNAAQEADAHVPLDVTAVGHYRILSRLGVGGMGAVYKALHTKLDKVVALKVLPADRLKDPGAVARFEREMRAVGKLHHPNIVAAHDAGEVNGMHYLVMELVEGIDLGTLLKQRGSLPVAESCEIIRQAALGLQHAHEHGLVHRDIKPSNLMLAFSRAPQGSASLPTTHDPLPTVKVLDLGLALLDNNQRELAGELTSTGQIMGTLDYMAPEQGADTHSVDIRADIYSLGSTLYKLLTGRAPFEGERYNTPMKKLTALATVEPQPVRELRADVPAELAGIVHQMLAKRADDRPTPPAALAALLQPFAAAADLAGLLDRESSVTRANRAAAETTTDPTVLAQTAVVDDAVQSRSLPPVVAPAVAMERPARCTAARVRTLLKLAALLVPLALITIQMKQGTVTIDVAEPLRDDVTVELTSGGQVVRILEKNNNWTVTIRAGEYEVAVRGGGDEFKATKNHLGVSRWGTTVVDITYTQHSDGATTAAAVKTRDSGSGDADRRVAEWVLAQGGRRGLVVLAGEERLNVADVAQLPPQFRIVEISLMGVPIVDRDLATLRGIDTLESLDLHNCTVVTDEGLRSLPDLPKLKKLDIGGSYDTSATRVTDAGLQVVAERFPGLIRLGLQGVAATDDGLRHVARLAQLQQLNLVDTQVTNAGMRHLLEMPALIQLDLPDQVGDEGLAELRELQSLKILTIGSPVISAAGLTAVAELPNLADLWLKATNVAARDLAPLARAAHLQVLHVHGSRLQEGDIPALRALLPQCRLDTDFGQFPPESQNAANFALQFDGRGAYVDIPSLTFDGSHPLTLEVRVAPRKRLVEDQSAFVLGNIRDRTRQGGIALRQFDAGWRASVFTDGGTPAYPTAPDDSLDVVELALVYDLTQTRLYVNGRLAHSVATAPAKHLPSAEGFAIGGPAGRKDSTYFDGVIDEVRISGIARYSEDFVPGARFDPDGHTLALYHFDEGDGDVLYDTSGHDHDGKIVGATWVRQVGPETWVPYDADRRMAEWLLSVGGSVSVTPMNGAAVSVSPGGSLPDAAFEVDNLTLDKPSGEVSVADFGRCVALPKVRSLTLAGDWVTDAHLAQFATWPDRVDTLNITGCPNVTDAGVAHLRSLTKMSMLGLNGTSVTDSGLEHVAQLRGLVTLQLMHSPHISGTEVGLNQIAQLPNLGNLDLRGCRVTDGGLARLRSLSHLQTLALDGPELTDAGIAVLKEFDQLTILALEADGITDAAIEHLAARTGLRELDVSYTKLTAEGVHRLRQALPKCRITSDFGMFEPALQPAGDRHVNEWAPTPDQQAFLDAVALVPAEQQESAVREKLKSVNPGYDGFFEHIITDGKIVRFSLKGNAQTVREIWPIAALTGLTELLLGGAPVADLSPVVRLTNLQFLSCYGTEITDIAPVSTLKNLAVFDCRETLVRDLSPLAGLPLKELRTFAVSPYNEQFRQLAETWPQLETINDVPIAGFLARRDEVEELRKRLPAFPAERQLELVFEKLKKFNPEWDGQLTHQIVQGKLDRILMAAPHVVWDVSPLAALPDLKDLTCNGNPQFADLSPLAGTRLEQLYCHASGIGDLSPLRGLRLKGLVCGDNPIDDLSPLAGMPLTMLRCDNSPVSDLSPLAGCPLEQLSFSSTRVRDLSPLTGMPLKYVECGTTRVTSLEALRGMQLTFLGCDQNGISDLSLLAGMPLEELRCSYTQVRDFSPLAGMPLAKLHVSSNDGLSDLSVLAGMPLAELDCRFSAVSDYSPLSGMPLERIRIDFHLLGTHDEEVLRSLQKVAEIHSVPAAEYWRQIDQRRREAAEWKDALSAVSGEQQFTTVRQKLIELHSTFAYVPSFSLEPVYADGKLVELSIVVHSGGLTDLRPLCGLTHLRKLSLTGHLPHVRDLSPLYALPLEELHVDSDVVLRSNTPGLRAIPTLQTINGRPAAEYVRLLADPDRFIAEWVLSKGGKVVVGQNLTSTASELPAERFRVAEVNLSETAVTDDDLAELRHLPGLRTLRIQGTNIGDRGFETICSLNGLQGLIAHSVPVTDEGLERISELQSLHYLRLSSSFLTDRSLASLAALPHLNHLSIGSARFTDAGLNALTNLRRLTTLSVEAQGVTDAGVAPLLAQLDPDRLSDLYLPACSITDKTLEQLARFTRLNSLDVRGTAVTDAGLAHLSMLEHLTYLDLTQTKVTAVGVAALKAALPQCKIVWDGDIGEKKEDER